MEDYAAKMLLKTDAALREYVTGHVQYREAAVLAALDELRRRGQPAVEEAALRPNLEAAAATQRTLDEAAEKARAIEQPTAARPIADEVDADAPALYSPMSIVLFSIMSVPIGGILLGINLFRLGKKTAVLAVAVFILAYMGLGTLLLSLATAQGNSSYIWALLGLNIVATMAYLQWFWPRYVGTTAYRNRSVLGPIIVCLLLLWGVQKISPSLMKPPQIGAPAQQVTTPR